MMHSSSSENAMLATVSRLRRLLRNADLATKLERVIEAKTFYAVPSFIGGAFGRARTNGAPFDSLIVLRLLLPLLLLESTKHFPQLAAQYLPRWRPRHGFHEAYLSWLLMSRKPLRHKIA